jgi:hypothetical protein
MSIRPVEIQMMVQKTVDIPKSIAAEQQHSAAHQSAVDKLVKDSLHNEERVLVIEKTEGEKVDEDGRSGGKQGGKKKQRDNRPKDGGETEPAESNQGSENRFDISI